LIAGVVGFVLSVGVVSRAQLPAFPGAEGAAMFASGGRGTPVAPGDVYVVTTLADYDPDNGNRSHPGVTFSRN
jgi:hypothetical protein